MRNWWIKYRALSKTEKSCFWQAMKLMLCTYFWLKTLPFNKFKKRFRDSIREKRLFTDDLIIQKSIQRASRLSPKRLTCLPQALVFKKMVGQNPDYRLVIGIKEIKNQHLDAHAWVEKNGIIMIGNLPDFEYLPLWVWN